MGITLDPKFFDASIQFGKKSQTFCIYDSKSKKIILSDKNLDNSNYLKFTSKVLNHHIQQVLANTLVLSDEKLVHFYENVARFNDKIFFWNHKVKKNRPLVVWDILLRIVTLNLYRPKERLLTDPSRIYRLNEHYIIAKSKLENGKVQTQTVAKKEVWRDLVKRLFLENWKNYAKMALFESYRLARNYALSAAASMVGIPAFAIHAILFTTDYFAIEEKLYEKGQKPLADQQEDFKVNWAAP